MDILEKLEWRYATKKFDATKKLDKDKLNRILRATSLSASSYGLQPYKVLVIEDAEVREKLKAASYGQPQVTDASQLIVFVRYRDLSENHVDQYINNIATTRSIGVETLAGYAGLMKQVVSNLDETKAGIWTSKQAYLALGTLLTAAAAEGVDAAPMEGFDPAQYDEILGLKDRNLASVVIVALGYRSAEDEMQHAKKVRKSLDELVEVI
ncbi:NAD(P)H-dependent oxidoreductase [Chitinophaga pendula]|uniref:NAD(P)H-dependent oxidoreductase n=1 Tax=Chitinophaga TaxID=79328 RepID=UPI000BAF0F8F|nr:MULTISPECIES: NAD(P)H-dependent oxidoreductase [Chitinophaga]ASZ09985.1 NAD(P)H-dependent oxidoreductase [Chitinophaga sp. MD30]UCJ07070.1 NAD(P)H-dependent oxidoreductase [Chitinophaga pendula]